MNANALWIDNPRTNPAWNLAAEEYLLCQKREPIAMLWRNERSVIIGRNQDLQSEVDMDFAEQHGITVVRRLTGGGAVFHDLGNVNFTFITPNEGSKHADFARYAQPIIASLAELGVQAQLSGRNDLTVDGRKVSGCAHTCQKDRALHHGTLLFSANLSAMIGVLKVNVAKYQSKGIASVASRVGNLAEWLSTPERPMDVLDFLQRMRDALLARGEYTPTTFSAEDQRAIDQLYAEKYTNMAWTDGGWRDAEHRGQVRTPGGSVEAWFTLRQGKIAQARLTGDFFGTTPIAEVEALLTGLAYDREAIALALPDELLSRALANVPKESLLDALFACASV